MLYIHLHKKAIALLITVFFVLLITVSVGIGLRYINNGSNTIKDEQFLFQSSIIVEDVLKILKNSDILNNIKSADDLSIYLNQYSFFPLEVDGYKILISIQSARSKVNPSVFSDAMCLDTLKKFLINKNINTGYADILLDIISGIKEDMSYNTDVFNENTYLFRDYITSHEHLMEIEDIYKKKYYDNSLKNIDVKELFYASKNENYKIDLNYATPLVWQLILGCDEYRAKTLSERSFTYVSLNDLALNDEELATFNSFSTSFFEPYVEVSIKVIKNKKVANIVFEYDIKRKKGSNFVYKV